MAVSIEHTNAKAATRASEIQSLFEQRFGADVHVAMGPEWERNDCSTLASEDFEDVWEKQTPQVFGAGQDAVLLAPVEHPGEQWMAVCQREFLDPQLAVEAARSVTSEFRNLRELERLTVEIDSFALQLTADFEELTFLRRIPDVMDSSASPRELIGVAKIVLRSLQQLVRAESVALLLEGDHNPFRFDDATTEHWVGEQLVTKEALTQVIAASRGTALLRPFIKNGVESSDWASSLPGVHEFMLVPVCKAETIMGWLVVINRQQTEQGSWRSKATPSDLLEKDFGSIEATLVATVASILATQASNVQHVRNREELLVRIVRVLVAAIEARDEYTCGHSERVARYARRIADKLGYSPESCERLYLTGLLHDVGKIGVSDAILQKPGRLTDEEFEEIKRHPDMGWAILNELEPLNYVLPGVLHHHERVDGKGYPDRLRGDAIPWDGRILAVADAYDAMTSSRPYRNGMPVDEAERILMEGAGEQWDATVVQAFFEVVNDINEIRRTYRAKPAVTRKPQDPNTMPAALVDDPKQIGVWTES